MENIDYVKESYAEIRPTYEALTGVIRGMLESLLKNKRIDFLSVSGRAKTFESFSEKIDRKNYIDPLKEMTDLCGIRIIAYIEDDVDKICEVIKKSFRVVEGESVNKSDELDVNKVGYRSVHFICDIGQTRENLEEYSLYKGLQFEIQVRTVLQHAWAEIEHDRNYKFSGVLPKDIRRRLHLISGILEVADREFCSLSRDIDSYATEVSEKTKRGDMDIEITSSSLKEYFEEVGIVTISELPLSKYKYKFSNIIKQMKEFGLENIEDVDRLLKSTKADEIRNKTDVGSISGLIRVALIVENIEKFFDKCWNKSWVEMNGKIFDYICSVGDKEKIESILRSNNITIKRADENDVSNDN